MQNYVSVFSDALDEFTYKNVPKNLNQSVEFKNSASGKRCLCFYFCASKKPYLIKGYVNLYVININLYHIHKNAYIKTKSKFLVHIIVQL